MHQQVEQNINNAFQSKTDPNQNKQVWGGEEESASQRLPFYLYNKQEHN